MADPCELNRESSQPMNIDPGSLNPVAPASTLPGTEQYGAFVCGVFMLNMVLGTGPMSLPYAFNQAGFLLSCGFLALMMTFSFITATYVIESLGTADRLRRSKRTLEITGVASDDHEEGTPEITERMEIGALGEALFPKRYGKLAYFILIIYAYGVLTVYVIAGCVSLAKEVGKIGDIDSYYIILAAFAVLVTPICLLDFQKTRPLQMCVGALRLIAVLLMMVVMVRYLTFHKTRPEASKMFDDIHLFSLAGLPSIFGNTAFTFMIHHSIPGLIFPLRRQADSAKVVGVVYLISYLIYVVQGFLALWAFGDDKIQECKNWPSNPCVIQGLFNTNFASADYQWAAKFIVLYPVLVVSVFPLVAITLRNNLKAAFGVTPTVGLDRQNLGFTALTVVVPYTVAAITKDVQLVLKYLGCYFGLTLMFLVPTLMIIEGRPAALAASLSPSALRSRFGGRGAIYAVIFLFVGAVLFSTVSFAVGKGATR